jgi:hypothetical protein
MKLLITMILLSACTVPRYYPLHVRQTLLHGSDAAIQQGCVRGVIRWHKVITEAYPPLDTVALFCEDVRRSFQQELTGEGDRV